ncbi:MAG: hypothetical protein H8E38_06235 [SAR324 cluster bacterium]|nr:hypothetical protein [SAR324 cluster bacterium]MBL7034965.1 hypothetical protein [SAR324 cluster bacterium]
MKIQPEWEFSTLHLDQIELKDLQYNWFPRVLTTAVRDSLQQNGVLYPLLVQAVPGKKYRVIDGFKRISWLANNGPTSLQNKEKISIPCVIISESMPEREVVYVRLETLNTSSSNYSGVHVGRILKQLHDLDFSNAEIAAQVFPKFGLKPSVRLVRQLLDLNIVLKTMTLQKALLNLGCEDLLPLLKFSQSVLPDVTALCTRMEVTGKKWRNLLQLLDEVSRLLQISVAEVLKLPEILEILGRSSLQSPVRYRLLKQQLETLRYPELSAMRKRFEQRLQRLNLAPRITLESDPYFENDDLTLSLKIRSVQELRKHLKLLGGTLADLDADKSADLWEELFAVISEK